MQSRGIYNSFDTSVFGIVLVSVQAGNNIDFSLCVNTELRCHTFDWCDKMVNFQTFGYTQSFYSMIDYKIFLKFCLFLFAHHYCFFLICHLFYNTKISLFCDVHSNYFLFNSMQPVFYSNLIFLCLHMEIEKRNKYQFWVVL